jgi:hypothetical protein
VDSHSIAIRLLTIFFGVYGMLYANWTLPSAK